MSAKSAILIFIIELLLLIVNISFELQNKCPPIEVTSFWPIPFQHAVPWNYTAQNEIHIFLLEAILPVQNKKTHSIIDFINEVLQIKGWGGDVNKAGEQSPGDLMFDREGRSLFLKMLDSQNSPLERRKSASY
jgi:hypothetical protein